MQQKEKVALWDSRDDLYDRTKTVADSYMKCASRKIRSQPMQETAIQAFGVQKV